MGQVLVVLAPSRFGRTAYGLGVNETPLSGWVENADIPGLPGPLILD
jgi:hypothetical protein